MLTTGHAMTKKILTISLNKQPLLNTQLAAAMSIKTRLFGLMVSDVFVSIGCD